MKLKLERVNFNAYMKCPKCSQIIKQGSKKCMYCDTVFINDNSAKKPEGELFSSTYRAPANAGYTQQNNVRIYEDEAPAVTGQAAVNEGVFTSSGRTAANGGNTQQHAVQAETVYTGAIERGKDSEYFSSDRTQRYRGRVFERNKTSVSNNDFFSSEKNLNERKRNENITVNNPDHDAEINPYEGKNFLNTPYEKTDHSVEYLAHTVMEFTKHRFAKEDVDRMELFLGLMLIITLICFPICFVYDKTKISFVVIGVYFVVLAVLSLVTMNTFKRKLSIAISTCTIVFSLIMLALMGIFLKWATAPELLFIYIPVSLLDVLCMRITKHMSRFHQLWEAYLHRGEALEYILNHAEGVKIYNSADFMREEQPEIQQEEHSKNQQEENSETPQEE